MLFLRSNQKYLTTFYSLPSSHHSRLSPTNNPHDFLLFLLLDVHLLSCDTGSHNKTGTLYCRPGSFKWVPWLQTEHALIDVVNNELDDIECRVII